MAIDGAHMKISEDRVQKIEQAWIGRWTLVPFTTGIFFSLYAFFWPESYGRWLGTIVHAFRQAAGL